jgi:hypothetical protein
MTVSTEFASVGADVILRRRIRGIAEMTRFPRPAKKPAYAGNAPRQAIIAAIAIAAVLALGALATDQYFAAKKNRPFGTFESANGGEIYTGSIVYMPDTGNACHQWLFDNLTGRFTDKGPVNCAEVDQGLDGPKHWSTARIKVISTGFLAH